MPPADLKVALDTVWTLFAGILVFGMNAGFACLEAGLCRAKNTVNILTKNVIVISAAAMAFWITGFGLMYGDGNALLGLTGFWLAGSDNSPAIGAAYSGDYSALRFAGIPLAAKFFFQLGFACTAASIVSGAIAERVRLASFIMFSFAAIGLIYPIGGHWAWGGGWLADLGFFDAAGGTVVHSTGGWCALSGVMILGPRLGRFIDDRTLKPIFGHSMSLATIGAFVLWVGWIGFNAGSPMAADPGLIARIALNTSMAGATGCVVATLVSWRLLGKPDLTMTLNGVLGGLVAVTASSSVVTMAGAVLIGGVGGVLVVYGVRFFDRVRLDDPVGALSVHLVNGVWGTVAVGLFATDRGLLYGGSAESLVRQLTGIVAVGAMAFVLSAAVWLLLKHTTGIRVSPDEETEGLDLGQHGMEAYPGFVPTQEASAVSLWRRPLHT